MAGRKIELDLAQIEALAGRGLTQAEICDALGICRSTLSRRKRDNDEVAAAIKKGRAKAHIVVANALFEAAKAGQSWAVIWYEKTRCGLTEDRILLDRIEAIERHLEDKNK